MAASATSGGIRAGRAFVELFADDSKLVRGLRAAEAKIKAFGTSIRNLGLKMVSIGAAILAPLAASARLFGSYGDNVAKMARRTGLSVEALSELQFAAGQSGVEVSELENGLRRMQRSIYDAGRGLSTATDALKDLGLRFEDLDGLSPEQQFKLLAKALSRIEDPTRKAAIAMTLFGRSGTQLLPLLAGGAQGIEALQAQARRLGLTMSRDDAHAAEAFSDALDRLWQVVRMGVFHIGAALAPALQGLADRLTRIAVLGSDWIRRNRQVIVTVMKVAAVAAATGVVIAAMGTIIIGLGATLGLLATAIAAVGAVFASMAAVVTSAVMAMLSPIGLVVAAVGALAGHLVRASDAGGQALRWLGGHFTRLKDEALTAYSAIADALAGGDIALAAQVLWLTLRLQWTRGIHMLLAAWHSFRDLFVRTGVDAWHGLLAASAIGWHALEVGWIETTAFFQQRWSDFVGFFARTWERIKAGAQKAWNWIKSLFDDSIDLQASNQLVEVQTRAAIERIEAQQQRQTVEREARRQTQRQRAAAEHEATLAHIGRENLDAQRDLDSEYARRMAENEAQLAAARQAWRDAVEAARRKAQSGGADDEAFDAALDKAREALAGLGDLGDLVRDAADRVGVRGTFNASALLGLQTQDAAAQRTAEATEQTARNTARLANQAARGRLVFT